jgi:hypothetical protein
VDNRLLRQFIVFSVDLAEVLQSVPLDPRVRWATSADKRALLALGLREAKTEMLLNASRIAVLEEGGRLVARNSYWRNEFPGDSGLKVRISADAIAVTDGFVDPCHRGCRHIAALKAFAANEYLAAGYRRMVSLVRLRNTASLHAHRNVGALPVFRIILLRGRSQPLAIWANGRLSVRRHSPADRRPVSIP